MTVKRVVTAVSLTLVCLTLVVRAAAGATAQPLAEPSLDLSVGYQVLHIPGQTYPLGISLGMSRAIAGPVRIVVIVPLTRRMAAVGEVNYQRVFFKAYGGDNETRVFVGVRTALR
jgi:hypothetical protein